MSKTIDLTFLNSFTAGNPEKVKKYIAMFLNHCPGQLTIMKEQLSSGDYSGLRGTAHALKPQITYMGIKSAEDLIKKIEHLSGSQTDVASLPGLFDNFNNICTQAMAELKEEIGA